MSSGSDTKPKPGKVYLVGAGPGAVDLLTLRAHTLITSATCLLHDDLVSEEILALAAPNALVVGVGKRCGVKTITQDQINDWMIRYAREGQSVVRLKSGDPLLFGRAAEEMAALKEADIRFEVVPGVSAGFAAAAAAGLALTSRITTSKVLMATRHLAAGVPGGLTGIGPEAALVLYMPGKEYAPVATELLANGWPMGTQCVVASAVGTPREQLITCRLIELGKAKALPAPVVMLFLPEAFKPDAFNTGRE
ncbi:uroporphyrinogen-III C-methyltransferase [Acidicapsa dinghuensis]|uniref:uroporphyrinogen-III C-methyltransferase n=1 Tax=Acidicapsa dinghuensis TaxID=2218256 RepID=A0ABW1EBZ2_9BACT|nr:uroporphyrinogen-III C-methyltransferase [Acidicapsa dinghuensis]